MFINEMVIGEIIRNTGYMSSVTCWELLNVGNGYSRVHYVLLNFCKSFKFLK